MKFTGNGLDRGAQCPVRRKAEKSGKAFYREAMDGDKKGIPFEGIDYSECRGQCGTLPCCGPCMKEKKRLADEAEIAKLALKYREWEDV